MQPALTNSDPFAAGCRTRKIRLAAYYRWEEAGRPEGRDQEFWLKAEWQVDNELWWDRVIGRFIWPSQPISDFFKPLEPVALPFVP